MVRKAINAMSALTELGLLHRSDLYELLKDTACFLIHPNLWLRQVRMLTNCKKSVYAYCVSYLLAKCRLSLDFWECYVKH